MDKDISIIFGVIGLGLLLWGKGKFLPSAIRLIGSALLIASIYILEDSLGVALIGGGLLTLGSSFFKIYKGHKEITISDGMGIVAGLVETIVGCVIGI